MARSRAQPGHCGGHSLRKLGAAPGLRGHGPGRSAGRNRRRRSPGLARRPTGVTEVHDLHVWSLSTTRTALTAHLVRPSGDAPDAFLAETTRGLAATFGIDHATLQVETGDLDCELAPDEVV